MAWTSSPSWSSFLTVSSISKAIPNSPNSTMVIVSELGHSATKCPMPWHLSLLAFVTLWTHDLLPFGYLLFLRQVRCRSRSFNVGRGVGLSRVFDQLLTKDLLGSFLDRFSKLRAMFSTFSWIERVKPPTNRAIFCDFFSSRSHNIVSFSNFVMYSSTLMVCWRNLVSRRYKSCLYSRGNKLHFRCFFSYSQEWIFSLFLSFLLALRFSYQTEAKPLICRIATLNFFMSSYCLYSKIISMTHIHSRKSYGSMWPSN